MRGIKSLLASLTLLALVGGIPLVLSLTVGNPLAGAKDLMAGDVTDQVVLDILAVIVYLAWLQFVFAVLVEMFSSRRRRSMRLRRIPGVFSGQQHLARALVTATLMLGPAVVGVLGPVMSASAAPVAAAVSAQSSPARGAATAAAVPTPAAAPVRTVTMTILRSGPRTWWDLAAAVLGNGQRWPELWQLNSGASQGDGTRLTTPGPLKVGWEIQIPATAAATTASAGPSPADGQHYRGPAVDPAPVPAGPVKQAVTVQPGETLAGIGGAHGVDWPAMWQANHDRPEPGGARFTDPDRIDPGWALTVPGLQPSATGEVVVAPGDTLSQLAADHGVTTAAMWAGNQNRAEPGAVGFTDPDVIEPGWSLTVSPPSPPVPLSRPIEAVIPGAAKHSQPEPGQPAHRAAAAAHSEQQQAAAAAEQRAAAAAVEQRAAAEQASRAAAQRQELAARVAADQRAATEMGRSEVRRSAMVAQKEADAVPVATMSTAGPTPAAQNDGSQVVAPLIGFGGGGVLLTGLVLAALTRARRRQFRHRRPGRTIAATPPELADIERSVLTFGRQGTLDVAWLDQALRSVVHALSQRSEAALPAVLAARLGETELELILAAPALQPPAPWTSDKLGQRWLLARAATLTYSEEDRDYHFAPFPALVSVGYTPGGDHWLLDLEQIGSLSLTGDPHRCLNLARFMASELSFNSWSEMLQVTVVGFGAEMAALNPERLVYAADLDTVITGVKAQLASVAEVMDAAQVDVGEGRLHDVAADTWAPQVVLIAPQVDLDTPDVQHVLTTLRSMTGRLSIALVLAYDESDAEGEAEASGTRWQLHVDSDGVLSIPALDLQLVAEQVPQDEAAALAQLMAMASAVADRPVPAADGDRPWDEFADQLGALRPELTLPPQPRATVRLAGLNTPRDGSVLPLPAERYVAAAAATETDIEVLAPKVSDEIRQQVIAADSDLDAEVAQWWDPGCARPKVRVLGPVGVDLGPQAAEAAARSPLCTEIVLYLVTRPRGATMAQIGTDIWPGEPDVEQKSKVKNAISRTRRWLGTNPSTGRYYLPPNPSLAGSTYRIDDVLIDVELFRRLRTRGAARGAEGIADFEAALALVSGVPFDGQRPRGYGWLIENPVDHYCTAMIADVSHIVATHYLTIDEPLKAAAAAQVALKAGSHEDTALLDAAGGCFDAGNRAEGASYIKRIMARHGAEEEEDLPKRTYEILLRRGWLTG